MEDFMGISKIGQVKYMNTILSAHDGRKPKNIKAHNTRYVLGLFRQEPCLTTAELSEHTRLSKTTIMKIISSLIETGIVKSIGKGPSTDEGGKKPELYAFNEAFRYILSICLYIDEFFCAVMDLKGNILFRGGGHPLSDDYTASLHEIRGAVSQTADDAGIPMDRIGALTVCCSGVVDGESGTILYPIHNKKWGKNLPIGEDLRRCSTAPFRSSSMISADLQGTASLRKTRSTAGSTI